MRALKDNIWALLRNNPDGLTVREIADMVDAELKYVRRVLNDLIVAYIDRWIYSEIGPSTAVWCVVEVPEHAARPSALPLTMGTKPKRAPKATAKKPSQRKIDKAKLKARDEKRRERSRAYEAKCQAERKAKELLRRMASRKEHTPVTPSGLTTIRGPWHQ